MEAIFTTNPGESIHLRVRRALLALARCVWTWQERARERRYLADMTDHMRADVGLTRAQAARESDKLFWQR